MTQAGELIGGTRPAAMVEVTGGAFEMGSSQFYPEEAPVRRVEVKPFMIDRHPVTVGEFRRFVKDTGYVTTAEQAPTPEDYPDADPDLLVPGSLVFCKTRGPVRLSDFRNWWTWMPGADWRHPEGPDSSVVGRESHPVTQSPTATRRRTPSWRQIAADRGRMGVRSPRRP